MHIIKLLCVDTGALVHTVEEPNLDNDDAIVRETIVKNTERLYSARFGKQLFAEVE